MNHSILRLVVFIAIIFLPDTSFCDDQIPPKITSIVTEQLIKSLEGDKLPSECKINYANKPIKIMDVNGDGAKDYVVKFDNDLLGCSHFCAATGCNIYVIVSRPDGSVYNAFEGVAHNLRFQKSSGDYELVGESASNIYGSGYEPWYDYYLWNGKEFIPNEKKNVEFKKKLYTSTIYKKIMGNFLKSPLIKKLRISRKGVIAFEVDEEGNLTRQFIQNSSGNKIMDAAALRAVYESAPFPARSSDIPNALTFSYAIR